MATPLPQDKRGGFYGLIIGGTVLFLALYGIVHFTNAHYAKMEPAKPPAAPAP